MVAQLSLSNGCHLPQVMMGTNGMDFDTLLSICKAAVDNACNAFDTAPNYVSEQYLGDVIKRLGSEYGINRDQLFIQTKLDWKDQMNKCVEGAFYNSLNRLGLEYIDSYLMHWPYPDTFVSDWKILEKLYKSGVVKSIGTCNFLQRHWDKLLASNIEILPHINQIELHPLRTCDDLLAFCKKHNILTQAYTPICKMLSPIKDNKVLNDLSEKYQTSIPKLILAWHVSRGVVPISKSTKPGRVKDNLSCVELNISSEDLTLITSLNEDYKFMVESWGCPGF